MKQSSVLAWVSVSTTSHQPGEERRGEERWERGTSFKKTRTDSLLLRASGVAARESINGFLVNAWAGLGTTTNRLM